eukprot:403364695
MNNNANNQMNTLNSYYNRSSAAGTITNSARFGTTGTNSNSVEKPINNYQSKYLQPTVASLQRQKSPKKVNLRDRIYELEDALLEIKSTSIQTGQNLQEHLEKENSKVVNTVNSQIQSLKQAIGTLADAVSEEIETLRSTMYSEIDVQLSNNSQRIEQIAQYLSKNDNDNSKLLFEINTLKDEVQTMQAIEGRNIEKAQIQIEEKLVNMKQDNKKLFEQLRMIIQSNSQQISVCTKELERLEGQIELVRTSNNHLNENYQDSVQKLMRLDKETTTSFKQLSNDLIDMKSLLKDQESFNQSLKSQLEQLTRNTDIKNQTQIQSMNEQAQTLQIKVDSFDKNIKKLRVDQETQIQSVKDSMKQSFQQLTQKLELTEQSKTSFESLLSRKLNSVEDLFETQRKELFASMSDLEKILTKKGDRVERAIREITQQLNITNPLLII